jgi:hypothetical protein
LDISAVELSNQKDRLNCTYWENGSGGDRTNYVLNMYNSGKSLANLSLNFDLIDERMNHSDKE